MKSSRLPLVALLGSLVSLASVHSVGCSVPVNEGPLFPPDTGTEPLDTAYDDTGHDITWIDTNEDTTPVDTGPADYGFGCSICGVDSDCDGISDTVEGRYAVGGAVDTDKDGTPDYLDT